MDKHVFRIRQDSLSRYFCLTWYTTDLRVSYNLEELRRSPVGRVVILHGALHVLQLIQHSKHVDKFT